MIVERSDTRAITVRLSPDGVGWEQTFLLSSDRHHDNQYCDHDLEKKHLDEAKARGAGIIDVGDLYDAMAGKWDKRADMNQTRPELRVANYLDALVNYNAEFYEPYAENFVMISPGNHETSVFDRHQTDLTERLVKRLQDKGSPVMMGTYSGWIRFMFSVGAFRQSLRLWYTHGYGGGGPVTRDMIQAANRQLVYTEADIMVSGHTHDAWAVPVRREAVTDAGRVIYRDIEVIKCGGYKDEHQAGGGWAVQKGHPPKPLGACWLTFKCVNAANGRKIIFETQRAK